MPKKTLGEDLDQAIESILRGEEPALSPAGADLGGLLAVAAALRGLPRSDFRAQLARDLRPAIAPHDLRQAVKDLPLLENRQLGTFDHASIGVFRFSGRAPWERHPVGDELILVLEGGGEMTVLAEDGPIRAELRPGRLFVCPRGLWHRPVATPEMTALYVTPLSGNQHSWAEDPRAS